MGASLTLPLVYLIDFLGLIREMNSLDEKQSMFQYSANILDQPTAVVEHGNFLNFSKKIQI